MIPKIEFRYSMIYDEDYRNIRKDIAHQGYKRSWQIVQKEGYNKIIKKFKEVAK